MWKYIILWLAIVTIFFTVGVYIPKNFVHQDSKLTTQAKQISCNADTGDVENHFDHPFERILTLKTIITAVEDTNNNNDDAIIVTGYTLFGIRITEARSYCNGQIQTIKAFIFI